MKKVEIRTYHDPDTDKDIKALFFDDKVFDWNIDAAEIEKARQSCRNEESRRAIHANIQDHLLRCFAIFMGKKYTLKEINEAIEKGYIE